MKPITLAFRISLLLLTITVLCGCQSAKQPGSQSHASVQLNHHPLAEVQSTTAAVFREEGYRQTFTSAEEMIFERLGSRADALKWGGWSGAGVTMRVKVKINALGESSYLLQADAYAVQNSSDPFFQTESRNILLNRRPYQQLLNEVAKRLP
jgi:hypothetical protein